MRISAFLENIAVASRQTGIPLEELLVQLQQEGLEGVYCNSGYGIDTILAMLEPAGLVLEGLWQNLQMHTMTPEQSDAAVETLVRSAAKGGAAHVLITPGAFHDFGQRVTREETEAREPEIRRMIEAMRRAKAIGDREGVAVTMEDYDVFCSPIVYPEVLRRFFLEIPGLQCSFDTGNFIACDGDVLEEFEFYADKIVTLHLKDRTAVRDGVETEAYVTEGGNAWYAAAVGSGEMHIRQILDHMAARGYTGGCIIELFGAADTLGKLKTSIHWLKEQGYAD